MFPYFIIFSINFFLAHQAEKNFFCNKTICKCFLLCIILLNTIFVGLRNFGIGIDTLLYINDYFFTAKKLSFLNLLNNNGDYDLGFLFLAKIASLVSEHSQFLLVLTEFVIIGFIIWGIYVYKKVLPRLNFVWFLLLFSAAYYYHSENLMRQFCAMAVSFFAFSLYKQKNYLGYSFFQVIGYSFHSTAILFLVVPIYDFISNSKGRRKYFFAFLAFFFIIFCFATYYYVISFLGHYGFINEVYASRYGENSRIEGSTMNVNFRYILEYTVPLFMIYYTYKKKILNSNNFFMLFILFVSMFLFEQIRFISKYMYRLGFYFGLIYYVYMAMALNTKKIEPIVKFLFIAFMYMNYYYTIVWLTSKFGGWSYEYTSRILGF